MHSLFIGLGGAGCSAVAEYARMVQSYGIDSDDKFLYFDTEVAMKNYYPIMGDDFVHLGSLTPSSNHTINKLVRDANEKKKNPNLTDLEKIESNQFLEWFDQSIRSGEPLTKGAEGVRMMSRSMLYADYDDIKTKIRNCRTWDDNGLNRNRRIYVVSGTCGGTGCGTALDMMYMIQEILDDRLRDDANDPDTNLLLIMPEGWVSGVRDPQNNLFIPYRTNPYAFFDEINGCMKDYNAWYSDNDVTVITNDKGEVVSRNYGEVSDTDAGKRYHFYRCAGIHDPFSFTVCQNAYLFDSVDPNTGEPLTSAQRSANVSNFLFIMETAKDTQDNLNTTISNQNRSCKFASRNKPFIEGFSASGIFVAQSWEELTKKYVYDKALYQLLKYGFFGVENVYDERVVEKLKSDLNKEISNKISTFEKNNKTKLGTILQKLSRKDLEKVYQNVKNNVCDKRNRVAEIFAVKEDKTFKSLVDDLAKDANVLLSEVKSLVFQECTKWIIDYNLHFAMKITNDLDAYYDGMYGEENGKIHKISQSVMKVDWWDTNKKETEKKAVEDLFKDYVTYLVYRNLCNADDGYFDRCRENLKEAIKSVNLDSYELSDGTNVAEMELEYKKYLNKLKNDTKRWVYPDLNALYNFETSSFVAGNEVEQKYSMLVEQKEDGGPVLVKKDIQGYDNHDNLLFEYKKQCVNTLRHRDVQWERCFEMSDNDTPDVFGRKIRAAFDSFVKVAMSKAEDLSQDDSLKIPFHTLNLDVTTQNQLISRIDNFREISLSVKYQRNRNPSTSLVVGDFTQNAWLQAGLFPATRGQAGANNMSGLPVQSTAMPDRVVSLFVRYGHALNDYRYYSQYETFFKYSLEHPAERINPTYNDKRFWRANGNLGEFFTSIKREKDKNAALKLWKNKYDLLIKFTSLFLYKMLDGNKNKPILTKMRPDDFFNLEKKESKSKSKGKTTKKASVPAVESYNAIWFGKTEDDTRYNEEDIQSYRVDDDRLKVDFCSEYQKITDLRSSVPFFEFWLRILVKADSNSNVEDRLDTDLINQAFDDTINEILDYSSAPDLRTFVDSNIVRKYRSVNPQTEAVSVAWGSLLADYINLCRR